MNFEQWIEAPDNRRAMKAACVVLYIALAALLAFFAFKNLDAYKLQP